MKAFLPPVFPQNIAARKPGKVKVFVVQRQVRAVCRVIHLLLAPALLHVASFSAKDFLLFDHGLKTPGCRSVVEKASAGRPYVSVAAPRTRKE